VKISLVSQSVGRENQNISKKVPSALAMCGAFFVQVVTNSFKYSSSWNLLKDFPWNFQWKLSDMTGPQVDQEKASDCDLGY